MRRAKTRARWRRRRHACVRPGDGKSCSSNPRSSGMLDRWERRLKGLARGVSDAARRARVRRTRVASHPGASERDIDQLDHLRAFALPLVREMADWPRAGWRWGEWLATLCRRWRRACCDNRRACCACCRSLDRSPTWVPSRSREVREVLSPRLLTLTHEPPRRRHGRVFVGTPRAARGRRFGRVRAGPRRARVSAAPARGPAAARRTARPAGRAACQAKAAGRRRATAAAAGGRRGIANACICRGRDVELQESRQRVPSFYVLDVARAVEGRIPAYCDRFAIAHLRPAAPRSPGRRPDPPDRAIDEFEHDLVDAVSVAARARSLAREGPRPLSVRAQPAPAAIADRALGAMAEPLASGRWADPHDPSDGAGAGAAAARRATVFAVRAATVCGMSLSVSPVRDLSARAARRAGAVAAARPADAREPLSQIQTEFFRELEAEQLLAGHRRRADAAREDARVGDRDGVQAGERRSRARDRSRLERRARVDRARSARLAR